MTIEIGERVPDVTLRRWTDDGMETLTTGELLDGKKVVLFAVPGAFTPTCSDTHLPGFMVRSDEIKAKGVDTLVCVAVNDPFVMASWAKALNTGDYILMLSDGNGEFARAMGLELDASAVGLGRRSKRYAAVIDDGVLRYLGVEPGKEVGVSGAEAVLEAL